MSGKVFAGALLLLLSSVVDAVNQLPQNLSRQSRSPKDWVWDNAVVPYSFDSNWNNPRDHQDFVAATRYIEERTCIRFRQRQGDKYFLLVEKGGCCSSYIARLHGFADRGQPITFDTGHGMPFYLHELGHALAFPHEQDRGDRDEHIYWDSGKNSGCAGSSFAGKYENGDLTALRFDYVSLMADWTECYWPRENIAPKNIPLGPGGHDGRTFSVVDIERLNSLYDCRGCYGYRFVFANRLSQEDKPIQAGYDIGRQGFQICRVYHEGHLLIGKSRKENDQRSCWAAYEGGEVRYTERFEILSDPHQSGFRWEGRPNDFSIPRNAIKGGRTKDRETVYIIRCQVSGDGWDTIVPGFVRESNGRVARVPFGGGARTCPDYFEYLVCG